MTTEGSSSVASTGTTDTGTPGTTEVPTSTTGASTGDPGFDPPTPVCGNGYLEDGEECDDANNAGGDGCDAECRVPCGIEAQLVALAPSIESELSGVAIAAAPDGGFVVAARQREITSDQEGNKTYGLARTRVLRHAADNRVVWDILLGPDDSALVPADLTLDAAGDIYVAGSLDTPDEADIHVARLAGADGSVLWDITHDGAALASSDLARGLALAPDGDLVVAGRASDVDKDADVWVRKLAAVDGAELWTTTWSGAGNGEFSLDDGGPVAIAADGSVYVAAVEYVDYNRTEAVLLRFGPDGGKAQWALTPIVDDVSPHIHAVRSLAIDSTGALLFSVTRTGNAAEQFWTAKIGPDKQTLWTRQLADLQDVGDEWDLGGGAFTSTDGPALAGSYRQKDKAAQLEWYEAWITRLGPSGDELCKVRYRAPSPDLLPPSVFVRDLAPGPQGRALVTGQLSVGGEEQLWVGLFRPE